MKKLTYITLLFFIFPLFGFSQKDTTKTNFTNQIDFDVQYISGELSYKHKIWNKISIGVGVSFGLNVIVVIEQRKTTTYYDPNTHQTHGEDKTFYKFSNRLETIGAKFIIDYKISDKFHVHVAPKRSSFYDGENSSTFKGMEIGGFYNYKKVEFGIKPIIGYDDTQFIIGTTLFIIRVRLSRW